MRSSLSHESSKASLRLRKAFSFPVFMGACLVLGAFGNSSASDLAGGKAFVEGDTWQHLAVGERILSTHSWPTTDVYSFTVHGTPWIAYEWLGEVLTALAMRIGGLRGMIVLLVVLAASFTLLLYYYAWLCSGNVKAAAVACVAVLPLAGTYFTLRPQLAGYCLFLIALIALEQFRRGRSNALWALPGVFLIWVNTHGSFLIGLLVVALYWVCGLKSFKCGSVVAEGWTPGQRWRLLLTLLFCILALLVTPYGSSLAAYPLELVLQQKVMVRAVTEWWPMDFSASYGLWFLLFLLLALLWQAVSPIVYRLEVFVFFLFTILETCLHRRFFIFFVLAFTPLLATVLARWMPPYEARKDHPVVNAAIIGLALSFVVALIPGNARSENALATAYPTGAVEYLRRHPIPVGMFNEVTWGGVLMWTLGPDHRVFIDGRADIYEYGGVLADYVQIISLQGNPLLLLQRYGIKACLIHRDAPLGTALAASREWRRVYEDKISTIFMRDGAAK
jgi:hypothetical protein